MDSKQQGETAMATMTATAGMNIIGAAPAARTARSRGETVAERNSACFEEQRKNRRGPTPEVFFTKHLDNSRIVKADDPDRRREMRTFTLVMSVLFLLVMVYVWQHFTAIEIGYHVESQKAQVEQLREENRQLRLSEAELSDPGRIDKISRQLGLDTPQPGQVVRPDGGDPSVPVLAQTNTPALPAY